MTGDVRVCVYVCAFVYRGITGLSDARNTHTNSTRTHMCTRTLANAHKCTHTHSHARKNTGKYSYAWRNLRQTAPSSNKAISSSRSFRGLSSCIFAQFLTISLSLSRSLSFLSLPEATAFRLLHGESGSRKRAPPLFLLTYKKPPFSKNSHLSIFSNSCLMNRKII